MADEVNLPLPSTSKTSWTIPLLLTLSIFSLSISGYLFWQNQQLMKQLAAMPTPTASPLGSPKPVAEAADPAEGWKTYTNTKYEFNVRYPNDWLVVENPINDPRAAKNSIRVSNNIGSVYISIYSEYGGGCPSGYQKIIIDNQPNDVCISETGLGEIAWEQIAFQKSNNTIELRGYAKKATPEELLIPQILATFKFL